MKSLKSKLAALFVAPLMALGAMAPAAAAEGGYPLDKFPVQKLNELPSLQNGARLFVNHCLNCHSAQSMRYNRLVDIGLTEEQIKKNLLFTADKVGETMKTSLSAADAKAWFGAQPPDLSVIARARASHSGTGADWLYTYLRTYYRDNTRPTGWNNAVYPNVGMPHVLWEMQGARGATIEDIKAAKDEKGKVTGFTKTVVSFDTQGNRTEATEKLALDSKAHEGQKVSLGKADGGNMDQAQYDEAIGDLVAYLTWMSDPSAKQRTRLGVWVLLFLAGFTFIAWRLNAAYWKDIK